MVSQVPPERPARALAHTDANPLAGAGHFLRFSRASSAPASRRTASWRLIQPRNRTSTPSSRLSSSPGDRYGAKGIDKTSEAAAAR
jgi:hypothetical protein